MGMDWERKKLIEWKGREGNNDEDVGGGKEIDGMEKMVNGERSEEKLKMVGGEFEKVGKIEIEIGGLKRKLRKEDKEVGIERILDEIIGEEKNGREGGLDIEMKGNNKKRKLRMMIIDIVKKWKKVEKDEMKKYIEKKKKRREVINGRKRDIRIERGECLMELIDKNKRKKIKDIKLVIKKKNIGRNIK